ncbi:hypothetical protein ACIODS_14790 [Micromonospora chalcea]|uniref:hypothetical protein n=1 Tax=Micromonospora chalcea TaxID=1874 RepID=UPI003812F0B5
MSDWSTHVAGPDEPDAALMLREYMAEMVRRWYGRPEHRGAGGGATRIRLDTRSDLVESRALYARHGYREIPAFTSGPYAQHWFEKSLSARVDDAARAR